MSGVATEDRRMVEFENLVERICKSRGWESRKLNGTILAMEIPLEGEREGRRQVVFLKRDREWIRYWAIAGDLETMPIAKAAPAEFYELVLQYNADLPTGAYALLDGKLIVTDTQLMSAADPEEVAASILSVATFADLAEDAFLGGKDAR